MPEKINVTSWEAVRGHSVLVSKEPCSDDTVVWLDILAVNQHQNAETREDVAAFATTVKACGMGTVVIVDIERSNAASRAWCLYEW